MFDRLSSLVIALTLIVIAAILAALAGGDPLTIAILVVAGFAAATIVHAAVPAPVPAAHAAPAPPPPAPIPSLPPPPDFPPPAAQEPHPLPGTPPTHLKTA